MNFCPKYRHAKCKVFATTKYRSDAYEDEPSESGKFQDESNIISALFFQNISKFCPTHTVLNAQKSFLKNEQIITCLEIIKHGVSPFSFLASMFQESRDHVCPIYNVPGTK